MFFIVADFFSINLITSRSELWLTYRVQEKAKVTMMKQKGSDNTESYWSNLWGKPRDKYQNNGKTVSRRNIAISLILMIKESIIEYCPLQLPIYIFRYKHLFICFQKHF